MESAVDAIYISDDSAAVTWRDGYDQWKLSADLGQMPLVFRSRAVRLLDAQRAAIRDLEERMRVTGRHLAALDSIPSVNTGGASAPAAYLDVTG